ncbi:MAG: iduronate-2-sulfatase, partial [Sphingobacterium sp.]
MKNHLLLMFCLIAFSSAGAHGQDRPYNVLVILVDDLRPALGAFGDEHAISPNIDEWSEQAMVFERAYSNQAV